MSVHKAVVSYFTDLDQWEHSIWTDLDQWEGRGENATHVMIVWCLYPTTPAQPASPEIPELSSRKCDIDDCWELWMTCEVVRWLGGEDNTGNHDNERVTIIMTGTF